MESAGQELVGVEKEQTKWAREYDLRIAKTCFLGFMIIGVGSLWNVWKYVPDFHDKIGFSSMILIPALLGAEVWKDEKRGEIKKPMAMMSLTLLGILAFFCSTALGQIVHAARAAAEVVK